MGFDETIIHCASPALCGIKSACLLSMSSEKYADGYAHLHEWKTQFSKEQRFFVPVKKQDGRFLLFVYDKKLIENILRSKKNQSYLLSKGYHIEKGLDFVLAELFHKLSSDKTFPHEVGLFLGYPLDDVIGFETHSARNFVYSGIWKVYGNKENAIRQMSLYKNCAKTCMELLASGLSVPLATKKYIRQIGDAK